MPSQQAKELAKERLTTAEVASNIIISNPGLTGKHIAAMTNCSQQPPTLLPNTAYSSPPAELLPGPSLLNMPLNQHTGWGFPPQHNSNHIFHNTLSPPVSMTTTAGGGASLDLASQHSNGGGLRSRLESAVVSSSAPPHSPLGAGGEQPLLNSPSQLNSSPRPRILRGKRPMDG